MRQARYSGQFYPEEKKELLLMLNNFLEKNNKARAKGIIVPHAGYTFSGKTAGKAYSLLKDSEIAVIIGTNHSSSDSCISLEDFQTPLGVVKNAEESDKIADKIKIDEQVHRNEHSIEVQIPFLQKINPDIKIIPLLAGHTFEDSKKLAETIYNSVRKDFVFIISSDFTHAGQSYGFSVDYQQAREMDMQAIKKILDLDSEGFDNVARKTTICGKNAILAGIELAKYLRLKPRLVDFSSSAELTGKTNFVNYASIVFE